MNVESMITNTMERLKQFVKNSENNQFSRFRPMNYLNMMIYVLRRNAWQFDPRFYLSQFDQTKIDRPIFLLGTPGGGLTLISRMLRRCQRVVSISGHYRYWSGADEMQLVFASALPGELSLNQELPEQETYGTNRPWLFATDDLLGHYRFDASDATDRIRQPLKKIIRWAIQTHAPNPGSARFIDKSQLYTINVQFLDALLQGADPQFLLVTRNPYAMCFRSTRYGMGGLDHFEGTDSFNERLRLAAEHWSNSMRCALEDGASLSRFHQVRFEDVLKRPEETVQIVCEHLDLPYDSSYLPGPQDRIPFGSKYDKKWYPLRAGVNRKHLEKMDEQHVEVVHKHCGALANQFGYERPDKTPFESSD